MRLFKGSNYNIGDRKRVPIERKLESIDFNVFKFNSRPRPADKNQIIIIPNFSEFGCESIALHYCLPKVMKQYAGAYFVVAGWYGREYLYRHLVDEYWEVKEEYQWLREYAYAFLNKSNNLKILDKELKKYGQVYGSKYFGTYCLNNNCNTCKHIWQDNNYFANCPKCQSADLKRSMFSDIETARKDLVPIPKPGQAAMELADKFVKNKRTVGIFARGRQMYGRNLTPDFYVKLIEVLRFMDYEVIWLGEKQSTIPCPVADVVDFSRMEEARDLELLLAIISKLRFTVQFWTASTRLASMVGTPWILFESPDQIVGNAQEGYRIDLTTEKDKRKIVLAHFLNVVEDHKSALELVKRAIFELNNNNWENIVGMVDETELFKLS